MSNFTFNKTMDKETKRIAVLEPTVKFVSEIISEMVKSAYPVDNLSQMQLLHQTKFNKYLNESVQEYVQENVDKYKDYNKSDIKKQIVALHNTATTPKVFFEHILLESLLHANNSTDRVKELAIYDAKITKNAIDYWETINKHDTFSDDITDLVESINNRAQELETDEIIIDENDVIKSNTIIDVDGETVKKDELDLNKEQIETTDEDKKIEIIKNINTNGVVKNVVNQIILDIEKTEKNKGIINDALNVIRAKIISNEKKQEDHKEIIIPKDEKEDDENSNISMETQEDNPNETENSNTNEEKEEIKDENSEDLEDLDMNLEDEDEDSQEKKEDTPPPKKEQQPEDKKDEAPKMETQSDSGEKTKDIKNAVGENIDEDGNKVVDIENDAHKNEKIREIYAKDLLNGSSINTHHTEESLLPLATIEGIEKITIDDIMYFGFLYDSKRALLLLSNSNDKLLSFNELALRRITKFKEFINQTDENNNNSLDEESLKKAYSYIKRVEIALNKLKKMINATILKKGLLRDVLLIDNKSPLVADIMFVFIDKIILNNSKLSLNIHLNEKTVASDLIEFIFITYLMENYRLFYKQRPNGMFDIETISNHIEIRNNMINEFKTIISKKYSENNKYFGAIINYIENMKEIFIASPNIIQFFDGISLAKSYNSIFFVNSNDTTIVGIDLTDNKNKGEIKKLLNEDPQYEEVDKEVKDVIESLLNPYPKNINETYSQKIASILLNELNNDNTDEDIFNDSFSSRVKYHVTLSHILETLGLTNKENYIKKLKK